MTATDAASRRNRAKSDRRSQLIAAAERLIAESGYLAVRLEDIGAAAGVSGPAIYRHFPNKEALLTELLVGISTRLLAGASAVAEAAADAESALAALIDFQTRQRRIGDLGIDRTGAVDRGEIANPAQ